MKPHFWGKITKEVIEKDEMVGDSYAGVHLVTKAGGFGKLNSLRKVWELL